ncbi:MAG TPA: DMT family transporter [Kofleriaceae bacterium]
MAKPSAGAQLHVIVVLWGFTAILGRLISISAIPLVWYRTGIVTLVLLAYLPLRGMSLRVPRRAALRYAAVGSLIGVHWVCFYLAVKLAGVATGVLTLSTGAFFTALFEPVIFKRRVRIAELVIGAVTIGGVALLLQLEVKPSLGGFVAGIAASLLSSIFGVYNGKFAPHEEPERLVLYELGAAALTVSLAFIAMPSQFVAPWELSLRDLGWLVALAVGCTIVAQVWVVRLLREVSPFMVAVATNLEPVYALIMAAILFPGEEPLRPRFYIGAALILGLVIITSARRARGTLGPRA